MQHEQTASPPEGGKRLADEEYLLMLVRPAMFRARPILFTVLAVLIVGSAAGAIWVGFFTGYPWAAIGFGVVGVAALAGMVYWKIRTISVALRITTERTIEDRGFFSRRTSEVMHENIRNVQISQSFWERLWKVGKLEIASAGSEGFEITFKDVPAPYEVRKLIDQHREFGEDD